MNEELKALIEKETGVKIDGQVTTEDILAVYNFLKPILDEVFPNLPDYEDAIIDRVEAVAMKRTGFRRQAILAGCKTVRLFLKCPDDDDNTVQK